MQLGKIPSIDLSDRATVSSRQPRWPRGSRRLNSGTEANNQRGIEHEIRRLDVLHRLFDVARRAGQALEERGFESVWAPEHSHIPLSRKTPFPGGGELPKRYYDAMDPFVTLTAAPRRPRR